MTATGAMAITTHRLECASDGCPDRLHLQRDTGHAIGVDDIYAALVVSGIYLGWRRNIETQQIHCPWHAHELHLVCVRCLHRDCFCMGGPRFEARPGDPEDE